MEYEIEKHREEEYNLGDYFVKNNGKLFRIIRTNFTIDGYKYALLDVESGTHVTSLHPSIDKLVTHTSLGDMTKVTQTTVAKFK